MAAVFELRPLLFIGGKMGKYQKAVKFLTIYLKPIFLGIFLGQLYEK